MSTLIVQLPARVRLGARLAEAAPAAPAELDHVFSADGLVGGPLQQALPEQLPSAAQVVAVLAPQDVAWHSLSAPRAPAAKLRAALASLLEDSLLEDEAELHLAVPPQWRAGEPMWVAVVHKPWLVAELARLEAHGLTVDRVVPSLPPEGPCAGHVFLSAGQPSLSWRDAQGPLSLPLASPAARGLVAAVPADTPPQWTASPEAAEAAEAWLGEPVSVLPESDRLWQAAQASRWNLRQFDLAPRGRRDRALRETLSRLWTEPAWRGLRWGVAALLLVQLVGANLWAWQQRHALAARKQAMNQLLQRQFPNVRAIIDAPAQMHKELDRLRAQAGRPGEADLETLLYAAEAAWPAGRPAATELHFASGKLDLGGGAAWAAPELLGLRQRLWPLGVGAEAGPGGVSLSPARGAPPEGPSSALTPAAARVAPAAIRPAPVATPAAASAAAMPATPAVPVPPRPPMPVISLPAGKPMGQNLLNAGRNPLGGHFRPPQPAPGSDPGADGPMGQSRLPRPLPPGMEPGSVHLTPPSN